MPREGRQSIATAGLAHAIARLSDSQQVCVVTDSPDETLATVAGLIRAADLGRDRFAILMSAALAGALPEVLAHAGIGLPATIDAGVVSLSTAAADPSSSQEIVALLRSGIDTLARPCSRRFAVVDVSHLGLSDDPQAFLALQIALGDVATELGVIVLALYDRSMVAPGIVHDAVSSHRLILTHGVLGENLHSVSPSVLIAHREAPLDVDQLLQGLRAGRKEGTADILPQEDAASRRLSEANELLQREIAQRVRMEHVLSASEERYRLLVEALPDCVFVHSAGAIVFINRAGVEMIRGAGPSAVLGKSIMSFVHPESVPTVSARVRMMMQQGLRAPMMVERFVRLDGTDFYAEAIATPLVFEGRPAIQVVMRDITARRGAEAELQFKSFLVDNAIDGIVVRRVEDGELLYVNNAMCALAALKREELIGSRRRVFIAAEEQEAVEGHVRAIAQEGHGIFETVAVSAQGARCPVEIHSVVVRYGEQQVMVSVIRDISERKRAEAQERHLSEQLQRAQKMEAIGTLASGIAHDFNNILTGILGYAELILHQTREGEPFHKAATIIGQAAERGASLTRRILTVARKEKLERHLADLNVLVRDAAELLRKNLPENIELVLDLDEKLPLLKVDPAQIDQVVMNLATNARDAMPDGGRLTIETAVASPAELQNAQSAAPREDFLRLAVSDTGIGMDEDTQQRVYDPFFTTKRTGRGTGLGLYIVHTVISNHGGQVRLYSEPGKGTRISVYLPVTRGGMDAEEPPQLDLRGSGTILVIDDEYAVREMCRDLLTPLGYTVLTAGDGEEGVRAYRAAQERIDLVVLDMIMPKMDGREVFEELRKIRADARVILCSGYSPSGYTGIETLIAAGARGFVQKPFTLKAIGTAIREALAGTSPP